MKEKNKIIYISLLFLLLILLIIGITYAYFNLTLTQEKDDTKIYSGNLAIEYVDGDVINNPKLKPVINPSLKNNNGVYIKSFKVYPSGNFDQNIDISLKINKNTFSEGTLNYILYNNVGVKVSSGMLSQSGNITIGDDIYMEKGIEKEFKILIWLKETGTNQNSEQGKEIIAAIELNGVQVVD